MRTTDDSPAFQPFTFPWAIEAWDLQEDTRWSAKSVPMGSDVIDWRTRATDEDKTILIQILRFFTQGDKRVGKYYTDLLIPYFKNNEIRMMLTSFANNESNHAIAYAYLINTLGLPPAEFSAFMEYEEMVNKDKYLDRFSTRSPYHTALSLAAFSGFAEGMQLFSSFAVLMNLPRRGIFRGLGQIVTWSIKDEGSIHVPYMIKLFHTFVKEQEISYSKLEKGIYSICRNMVKLEFAFIDLCFKNLKIEGLTKSQLKKYIHFIANMRLRQLGFSPLYSINKNPLKYMDECLGQDKVNFFENTVTDYAHDMTSGTWDAAYDFLNIA